MEKAAASVVATRAAAAAAVDASEPASMAAQIDAHTAAKGTIRSAVSVSVRGTMAATSNDAHTTHKRMVTPSSNDRDVSLSAASNNGPVVNGIISQRTRKIHNWTFAPVTFTRSRSRAKHQHKRTDTPHG